MGGVDGRMEAKVYGKSAWPLDGIWAFSESAHSGRLSDIGMTGMSWWRHTCKLTMRRVVARINDDQ